MTLKYIKEVCKMGQEKDCCRYLLCGADGFCCGKHGEFKAHLDARVLRNDIVAQGDNCEGMPEGFREVHHKIFDKCLELQPDWKNNKWTLMNIIIASVTDGDEFKRVTIQDKTYLVPIADIICVGIKGSEVPSKYKEAR